VYYLSITVTDRPPFHLLAELESILGPTRNVGTMPLKFLSVYRSDNSRVMNWVTANPRTALRFFNVACRWSINKPAIVSLEYHPEKNNPIEGGNDSPLLVVSTIK
jgi:hypothetical protein